jgi:hypothetical protein
MHLLCCACVLVSVSLLPPCTLQMERWMQKQSSAICTGPVTDAVELDTMLRDMASLDKLVQLQDSHLRDLKSNSV